MITDESFASIAEHAALKALLHSVGCAVSVFGKDETALISEREEDMNKQISLSHHLNVGEKQIIFLDVPRLNALAVEGLHLSNPKRSMSGIC